MRLKELRKLHVNGIEKNREKQWTIAAKSDYFHCSAASGNWLTTLIDWPLRLIRNAIRGNKSILMVLIVFLGIIMCVYIYIFGVYLRAALQVHLLTPLVVPASIV